MVPQPRARSNGEIEDHRSALLAVEPESYEDDSNQERFYVGLAESLKTLSKSYSATAQISKDFVDLRNESSGY